jgi:hypothetical protein
MAEPPNTADLGELVARLRERARTSMDVSTVTVCLEAAEALTAEHAKSEALEKERDETETARADLWRKLRNFQDDAMMWQYSFDVDGKSALLLKVWNQRRAEKSRADKAEAEVAALQVRVVEVLEPPSEWLLDQAGKLSGRKDETSVKALALNLSSAFKRRAAELHASLTGKTDGTSASTEGRRDTSEILTGKDRP